MLSQSVEVAFPLIAKEVVAMGRYPHFKTHPGAIDEEICAEVMDYFEVREMAERSYGTLSGGERQRVAFARVLAQVWRPIPGKSRYLLLLDEPLTFLDIRHQLDFMKRIGDFSRQKDVVVAGVVHDLGLAARFADEILLHEGRLKAHGPSPEVLTEESIRAVFEVEPRFVRDEAGRHLTFVLDQIGTKSPERRPAYAAGRRYFGC